jgi:FAD/FMN-containing dehydrogenase
MTHTTKRYPSLLHSPAVLFWLFAEPKRQKIESLLGAELSSGRLIDGVIAPDSTHATQLWALRESMGEALRRRGHVTKFDVSLPLAQMHALAEAVDSRVGSLGEIYGFGHVGDNNLHLNVVTPRGAPLPPVVSNIDEFVYEFVGAFSSPRYASCFLKLVRGGRAIGWECQR